MSREAAGRWLRFWRQEAELTQREIAAAIELNAYTKITNFERGQTQLPYKYFAAYADAVEVDRPTFAKTLLGCYEPELYSCLYTDTPSTVPDPEELRKRVSRLEQRIARLTGYQEH